MRRRNLILVYNSGIGFGEMHLRAPSFYLPCLSEAKITAPGISSEALAASAAFSNGLMAVEDLNGIML